MPPGYRKEFKAEVDESVGGSGVSTIVERKELLPTPKKNPQIRKEPRPTCDKEAAAGGGVFRKDERMRSHFVGTNVGKYHPPAGAASFDFLGRSTIPNESARPVHKLGEMSICQLAFATFLQVLNNTQGRPRILLKQGAYMIFLRSFRSPRESIFMSEAGCDQCDACVDML